MKSLQLEKPHAIVVVGIQGSGKSFFAEKFAETFSAPYIDDSKFIELTKNSATSKQIARMLLGELIKTRKSIIIETHYTKADRIELTKKLQDADYETFLVWVQTDTNTAMGRARKSRSISTEEYKENIKSFSAPGANEQALVISGKHTFASQAKAILKRLSASNRPPIVQNGRSSTPAQQRGNIVVR